MVNTHETKKSRGGPAVTDALPFGLRPSPDGPQGRCSQGQHPPGGWGQVQEDERAEETDTSVPAHMWLLPCLGAACSLSSEALAITDPHFP